MVLLLTVLVTLKINHYKNNIEIFYPLKIFIVKHFTSVMDQVKCKKCIFTVFIESILYLVRLPSPCLQKNTV